MSWEQSKTSDVLWGARKEVLAARSVIESMVNVLDPIGCERNGLDRYGNPIEHDGEHFTTLELLCEVDGKLARANSALHEVSFRIGDLERQGGL